MMINKIMKKRKNRDIIFTVGVAVIVVIVGVGLTNVSRGQSFLGRTITITDEGIIIEEAGEQDILDEILGGLTHNVQIDFSEGISVDGTEVIDGDGLWVSRVSGTTSTGNVATLGSTTVSGCLIMGRDAQSGLYYTTVGADGISLTTTGGVSGAFTTPTECVPE